ncbi:MAG: hypothetical protein OSB70_00275 [Myxococcota bacterium]|nr:hypothetical protein [Myxococcota bacterium]
MKNFIERDDGNRVGIVRFLRVGNVSLHEAWFEASRHWIEDVGGERIYAGALDVVYGRSFLSFERLIIEEYPSRQAAIDVIAKSASDTEMGLRASFVMALTPSSRFVHRLISVFGIVVRFLRPIRVREVPEVDYPKNVSLDGLSSDQAQISTFYQSGQWSPFTMVNLNGFKSRAEYQIDGEHAPASVSSGAAAYERYARRAAIQVFRRGGNFYWIATPVAVLAGDSDHPLARQWSQFVLVAWPSRMAFRHMIVGESYSRGTKHRSAGIAESIVIPGTPFPGFDNKAI